MKDVIKPTTEAEKEGEPIVFTLEDKDYLLITALQDLTNQIRRLADK